MFGIEDNCVVDGTNAIIATCSSSFWAQRIADALNSQEGGLSDAFVEQTAAAFQAARRRYEQVAVKLPKIREADAARRPTTPVISFRGASADMELPERFDGGPV